VLQLHPACWHQKPATLEKPAGYALLAPSAFRSMHADPGCRVKLALCYQSWVAQADQFLEACAEPALPDPAAGLVLDGGSAGSSSGSPTASAQLSALPSASNSGPASAPPSEPATSGLSETGSGSAPREQAGPGLEPAPELQEPALSSVRESEAQQDAPAGPAPAQLAPAPALQPAAADVVPALQPTLLGSSSGRRALSRQYSSGR
jgi:hypothetical protein